MINISQRRPEADDRAAPGHGEGDPLIGRAKRTAIGTPVERGTGHAMLVSLPDGHKPEHVAPAPAAKIHTLPESLRRSPTRDRGPQMRDCKPIGVVAGIDVFLCDPHAPSRRGPTRTPRDGCVSTSRRAPTSAPSQKHGSTPSPMNSTTYADSCVMPRGSRDRLPSAGGELERSA